MSEAHDQDDRGPDAAGDEGVGADDTAPPGATEPAPGQRASRPEQAPGPDRAPACPELPLGARIEALLLSSDRPLAEARLAELLGLSGKAATRDVRDALAELNRHYEQTGRAFGARQVAGGWQLMTRPDYAPLLERMHQQRQETRLSQAALETLSIIAYRQPVMRAEIEAIRGVACGDIVRGLLERRLIRVTGRAEQIGRPLLYGTTPQFLKVFGLAGLDDLPPVEDAGPARPRTPAGEDELGGEADAAGDEATSHGSASLTHATQEATQGDHGAPEPEPPEPEPEEPPEPWPDEAPEPRRRPTISVEPKPQPAPGTPKDPP